jgi:hypothetical protein
LLASEGTGDDSFHSAASNGISWLDLAVITATTLNVTCFTGGKTHWTSVADEI